MARATTVAWGALATASAWVFSRSGETSIELVNRVDAGGYSERDLQMLEIFARYTSISIENLLDAQRASEMARRDDLTGLYNDRFFHHLLPEWITAEDPDHTYWPSSPSTRPRSAPSTPSAAAAALSAATATSGCPS